MLWIDVVCFGVALIGLPELLSVPRGPQPLPLTGLGLLPIGIPSHDWPLLVSMITAR